MRYFWHFLSLAIISVIFIILFFSLSLSVKDEITFTDQQDTLTTPTVTIADPALGPLNAPVTLVNYGDYECEACAKLEESLITLRAEYPETLRIVWKDMPNVSQHPEALNAALAAQCAGEQDKFWEYHSLLMINQDQLGLKLYTEIASELNLKDRPFARCLEEQSTLPLVQRGFEEGLALGITATPTLYINDERYTGVMTTSELKKIISNIIAGI